MSVVEPDNPVLLKPIAIKVILAIIVLWIIKGLQVTFSWDLGVYGVFPRSVDGLVGIITAPLIHGSFEHLFSNTLALFILTTALFYEYPKAAKWTFIIIYIGSGLGVWLFARESYHYGASGLTHGMLFFLFLIGILRRDKPAMAIAMIVFFLYGSMVWGVLPTEESISFESHLFGALMGIICAILFRKNDPKPPEKKYSWEIEDSEAEADTDNVIEMDWDDTRPK
ncbi:MAG: rhomboid family intramembrane serine protease [Methylophaga sp.]|nr:MAG: rhomboid family intramembrane serine protease [Methylophaga sp.]